MDSEVALQDLCSRVIQQLRQIRADLVHLTEKYLETHGFHDLPHFDIHGGSASMGSDSWMKMAMEERLLANITAYIKLERRLTQVIEEQAESLLQGEGDLHGGLQNLMEQVSSLRAQLEYLGTTIGVKMESDEGTDEFDGESGSMFERKVRGYHVLRELSMWAVRSVRDVRKLQREQKLANKTETPSEGSGQ
ncbi:PREDICTED: ciliary neurotrophic factor [Nanorana parkeri]|uniref:ciliary neurotrophic factor n=1 Tax=Nanorana parkeri TaxID=125878 RepID=UPI000854D7C3|nr:PREDICTED: ciliary neurotrophic factor [Nanorana parkeri]